MAIRRDDVQLHLDFITDESRALARTLETTKAYNRELEQSKAKIAQYQRELAKVGADEARRAPILTKIAAEEKKVADNLARVAVEGKKVEALDLSRVTPAQLVERAKQLAIAMRQIPQSAPQFKQLEGELSRVNTRLRELNQSARGIGTGATGGGGGFLGSLTGLLSGGVRSIPVLGQLIVGFQALSGAFKGASDLEQLNISFETFLGNAEAAKQVVLDLRQFADVTPFETEQVNKAGRSLLAFGFSAQELIPTLTKIGDVAAGTGKDFNELALIYGKARTEGIIQNDTLNQLAEAGVPIYSELSKVLGVAESQIRKLAEKGEIQFADLQQAFTNLTGEGSKFGGLMEKQSKSVGGLYSTLKSSLSNLLTDFGTVLAPLVKRSLEILIVTVEGLGKVLKPVFELFEFGFSAIANLSRQAQSIFTNELPAAIGRFVRASEELPVVGRAITFLLTPLRLVLDAFESLPATASGVMAALTDIFSTGGKNAGQAYADARRKVLEEERQEEARAAAEDARDDRQLSEREQAQILEQQKKAAVERAAEAAKEGEERRKRLEAAFQAALKAVEVGIKRQELLLENQRIKGEITEAQYNNRLLDIHQRGLEARLDVFRQFHREEEAEALEARNKLETIERSRLTRFLPKADNTAQPGLADVPELAAPLSAEETSRLAALAELPGRQEGAERALQDKFNLLIGKEEEYELARLELKKAFLEEELALLRASSEPQVAEITRREEEKRDIELKIGRTRVENEQRLEALKQAVMQQGTAALADVFAVGAELLSQDEKSKKKHASAIRAFQVAQVQVSLFGEVQSIFENAQKSPIAKLLGPVAGTVLAFVQAGLAIARAGIAVGKINATKFAGGGFTGTGYGAPDETGFRPAGIVHEGEYVVPKRIAQDRRMQPVLNLLEQKRLRGYATGGFVTVDTTPAPIPSVATSQAVVSGQAEMLDAAVKRFERVVAQFPTEVKSRVVYTEIEEAGETINAVREDAAL